MYIIEVDNSSRKNSWDFEFEATRNELVNQHLSDEEFIDLTRRWLTKSSEKKYTYQFDWLGIPIIQMPSDLIMFQEIIWKTRPSLIIETGIARGGSLNFWAAMQFLCEIPVQVIGIDIEIREHTKNALNSSRFNSNIHLINGNSTDNNIFDKVRSAAKGFTSVMVVLDSNHTHEHVLEELVLYSKLVTPGCYLLVLDTIIDSLPSPIDRNWQKGNSPLSAVKKFLGSEGNNFIIDKQFESRSLLSYAPSGFLRKIS
jgi:cephalosporin hydroxylase